MRTAILTIPVAIACLASGIVAATPQTIRQYAELPLAFVRQGDAPPAQYVARGNGYAIGLREGNATIGVQSGPGASTGAISVEFVGGRHVSGISGMTLPGKVNYIRGNDSRQWQVGLPTYGRVTYSGLYPGVDVAYYGKQGQLDLNLSVQPGADPTLIRIRFGGARRVVTEADGALTVESAAGQIRIPPAAMYQEAAGTTRKVAGRWAVLPGNEAGFRVDAYDRAKLLIIHPAIAYSGLLGGESGPAYAITQDSAGNGYAAGYASPADFGANRQAGGNGDGFVAKMNAAGTALVYTTFIGGSSYECLQGIAVDRAGAAWVAGYTYSPDFPVSQKANPAAGAAPYGFVAKIGPDGATLAYSTYLAGKRTDEPFTLALDASGNAHVTGYANSGQFPALAEAAQAAPQKAPVGGAVIFVDPVTREIRQPSPSEIGTLSSTSTQASPASQLPEIQGAGGAVGVKLGDSSMVYMVVSKTPDGKLATDCVDGDKAAASAIGSPDSAKTPATPERKKR